MFRTILKIWFYGKVFFLALLFLNIFFYHFSLYFILLFIFSILYFILLILIYLVAPQHPQNHFRHIVFTRSDSSYKNKLAFLKFKVKEVACYGTFTF